MWRVGIACRARSPDVVEKDGENENHEAVAEVVNWAEGSRMRVEMCASNGLVSPSNITELWC
jgi:hypothetical protein